MPSTLRLAAYGLAGAAILAAGIGAWVKVSGWRQDSQRLPAVEAQRDAYAAMRDAAERSLLDQTEQNRKREHDFNEALVRAGRAARDLSDGLRRYYASLSRPVHAAPAPAVGADVATREPGDRGEVDEALAEHLEACARDAERVIGLQAYVSGLPERCVPSF